MTSQESKIADLIAKMDDSKGFSDNFESFIDYCIFPFVVNPSPQLRQNFVDRYQDPTYTEALLLLGEAAEDYHDCFGEIFMDRISHGAKGQFFTPEHIAHMMAEITEPTGNAINDCACGSGRLLLGGLRHSRANGKEPFIYAGDVDYLCCKMVLLNLCLNSARGEVRNTNAMTGECFGAWRIDRLLIGDVWVSWVWYYDRHTDMDALNAERQRQIEALAYKGVIFDYEQPGTKQQPTEPKPTPKPEPVQVEQPKQAEPLQLTLF